MNRLIISVTKILGKCSSAPPMQKGDYFLVDDGDIRIPEGRFVCIWALQSVLPLVPAKERKIAEHRKDDWMWRVHHVQCPDPAGRVVFKIEKAPSETYTSRASALSPSEGGHAARSVGGIRPVVGSPASPARPLRIVVDAVRGKCTSGMKRGDSFVVEGCRLYIPPDGHVCLYALQAVLPFLAAKARRLEDGDWLKRDDRFICPDPAGNVILRIDVL